MRTLLLNSAVIPHNFNGICQYDTLTESQFVEQLQNSDNIESYIGYQETIQHIMNIASYQPRFNLDIFDIGCEPVKALVCRLHYRVKSSDKGNSITSESWDYGKIIFIPNY